MTPTEIMTIGCRRGGWTVTSATFANRAREYLNDALLELQTMTDWVWMFKNASLSLVSGTRNYDLAADVMQPLSFRDTTNDIPLKMRSPQWADQVDPDQSSSGNPEAAIVLGQTQSNGYWNVDFHPTPGSSITAQYRYWSYIPLVSSDSSTAIIDSTNLDLYVPRWLQPALYYDIAERILSENMAEDNATKEKERKDRILGPAIQRNNQMFGDGKTRLGEWNAEHVLDTPVEFHWG